MGEFVKMQYHGQLFEVEARRNSKNQLFINLDRMKLDAHFPIVEEIDTPAIGENLEGFLSGLSQESMRELHL